MFLHYYSPCFIAIIAISEKLDFDTSIFTGLYITPLGETYLSDLETSRQDQAKQGREAIIAN